MFQLPDSDRLLLLKIARNAVEAHLSRRRFEPEEPGSSPLVERRPAFVSIHRNNQLRGCIGNLQPSAALYHTVIECAVAAAVEDPRFMPLTSLELDDCRFEISVLSDFERIDDIRLIEVGKHGLLIGKHNAHGLLLPQVASAYGWNRERFLAETCRKAGLRPADWKDGAVIFRFTAEVFHESRVDEIAAS